MLETYVQKGEVILIHSAKSFDIRHALVQENKRDCPNILVYSKEKVLIDDVRDFTYELQKESIDTTHGVKKLAVLVCDDIAQPAQHALLKVLEDMSSDDCILIYTHSHSVFLPTVLSRVIVAHENEKDTSHTDWNIHNKTVAERFDMIKKIIKEYEDEKVTKQDIVSIVTYIQEVDTTKEKHIAVYVRALSMLKQPSVSIKYVLEYVCAVV
jgi:DNA polymerase III, delta subunit